MRSTTMCVSRIARFVGLAFIPLIASAQAYAQSVAVIPSRSLASGETRVELYGVVDAGIEHVQYGSSSANRMSSGIAGGTRWGIRGSEDLGGGYRAIFELESRVELNNGSISSTSQWVSKDLPAGTFPVGTPASVIAAATPTVVAGQQSLQRLVTTVNRDNALFDREAFVGLVTPYGAILGGRMYTPGYEMMNAFSVYGDATAGQIGQGYASMTIRANNAIAYRARFFENLVVSAMYSLGGNETIGGGRNQRANPPTAADDMVGFNVRWTVPTFDVGIGYNRNNTLKVSTNESVKGLETLNAGASVKLGSFRIYGEVMTRKNDNPIFVGLPTPATSALFATLQPLLSYQDADLVSGQAGATDMRIFHLSAGYQLGNGTLTASATRADDRRTINADVDHYSLGYFHELSKRTTLYTVYALANNKGAARMGIGSAGFSGGFTPNTGDTAKVLQTGIRHIF
jgi:predicted porin